MRKKLKKADIAGMDAIMSSSPDMTMLQLPTWLVRGYIHQHHNALLRELEGRLPEKLIPSWKSRQDDMVAHTQAIGYDKAIDQVKQILADARVGE